MVANFIADERGAQRRNAKELELRLTYSNANGETCLGRGRTIDIGAGGIRFLTDTLPPAGSSVELIISWPYLLQDVCQLELIAQGIIVTAARGEATLLPVNCEFRTCGGRSFTLESETPSAHILSA